MSKFVFSVMTEDYDEAFEKAIEESDYIIRKCAEYGEMSFILELNKCKRYELNYSEEFDCETIAEYEISLIELFDNNCCELAEAIFDELLNKLNSND